MNDAKLVLIKAAIYEMGLLFNQQPSEEKILAYAKALMNYEPNQIKFAFKQVIKSGSAFFPSLAEILKHLIPAQEATQDRAPQVAAEMLNALRLFGPHAESEMLQNVSEDARLTFLKLGFTGDVRNSENIDTVRAQLERLARAVINSKEAQNKNENLQRIGIDTGRLLKMKPTGFQTVDFSGLLPPEGA